jgi:DUF1365 family protein
MNSRLYECRVVHERFQPKSHRFTYRLFLLAVDLDELPVLNQSLHLFSVNRPNLYALRESDYLPITEPLHNPSAHVRQPGGDAPVSASLKARALAYFAAQGIDAGAIRRIELLTLPRLFGYAFNPVSFYFAYDAAGQAVAAIAEVTNTFREMKPYAFGPADFLPATTPGAPGTFHRRMPKFFYVSPFSAVDVHFDFQLRVPTEKLRLQIDDYVGAERTLTSHLSGPARPLTDTRLAGLIFRYPLLTLRIIVLIHWHALRLFWKKAPWFAKSARPGDQRDLYHPHTSLSASQPTRTSASPDA